MIRAIEISGLDVGVWTVVVIIANDKQVGRVSSAAYSPDFKTNVAVGMVKMTHWDENAKVKVVTNNGVKMPSSKKVFGFRRKILCLMLCS